MPKISASQRLENDLVRDITDGKIPPDMAIPSENDLAGQYSISRPTVRKILARLCERNLLEKRPGKGTFVRDPQSEAKQELERPFTLGMDRFDSNPYYTEPICKGITESPYGRNVYFSLQSRDDLLKGIVRNPIDGLMLTGNVLPLESYEKLRKQGIRILHFNRECPAPDISFITVNHVLMAEKAVEYLLNSGCRNILAVGVSSLPGDSTVLRLQGWRNAYRAKELTPPEDMVVYLEEIYDRDRLKIRLGDPRFDALFFCNYSMYLNFMPEFQRYTGKHPEEIPSFIFDDCSLVNPDGRNNLYNYVRMPLYDMGRRAIEILRENPCQIHREVFPCSLVINRF